MSFEKKCIEQAIDKLLNTGKSFNICLLDDIGSMIGVNPEKHPRYKYLRSLHCVNYSLMDKDILDELPLIVADTLRPNRTVNPSAFLVEITREGADTLPTEDRFLN